MHPTEKHHCSYHDNHVCSFKYQISFKTSLASSHNTDSHTNAMFGCIRIFLIDYYTVNSLHFSHTFQLLKNGSVSHCGEGCLNFSPALDGLVLSHYHMFFFGSRLWCQDSVAFLDFD